MDSPPPGAQPPAPDPLHRASGGSALPDRPPRDEHRCKDCRYWYGAEDDEYGPCQIKQSRGDRRFVTFGGHLCDEPLALKEYNVKGAPA